MTEINPCPFCENRPEPRRVGDDDGGYWSVEHQHSGEWREMFIGCHGDSEEEAIKGWNSLTERQQSHRDHG